MTRVEEVMEAESGGPDHDQGGGIVYFIFPVLVSFLAIIYKLLHALTSYLVCIVYIWSGNMCECLSKIGQLLLVLPHLPLC